MNIKSIGITILIVAIASGITYKMAKVKIAYVDVGQLMNEYYEMKNARIDFKEKTSKWDAQLDTLTKEFETDLKAYESNHAKMSATEKKETEKKLRAKQEQVYKYGEEIKKKKGEEENKANGKIINKVNQYIKNYGAENGYKIIFGANEYSSILYGDDAYNITGDILKGLNKTATK